MKLFKAIKDFVIMILIGLLLPCLSLEASVAIFEELEKDGWKVKKN